MLINLYILSLVLGAVLLTASLFLSDKRVDADDTVRPPKDPARPSQVGQLDGVGGGDFFTRTLRSRRFWTFFVCFFGMTGLVLDGLDVMSAPVAFIVAVAVGAISGAGISAAVRIGSS
ncbi:MAG TPA: hypothetical protein VLS88_03405 [Polyangiales bacterium]|nr:hypothetical protein [Polyangiales bacterium]